MIELLVSEIFERIGHTWKVGGGHIVPTDNDVRAVLDTAAGVLYDRDPGTQIQSAGLIVEKQTSGHDVYVYVGNYK